MNRSTALWGLAAVLAAGAVVALVAGDLVPSLGAALGALGFGRSARRAAAEDARRAQVEAADRARAELQAQLAEIDAETTAAVAKIRADGDAARRAPRWEDVADLERTYGGGGS